MARALLQTDIPGYPCRRGKVRDIYDLGRQLVVIATDRVSAFDRVLPNGIPDRGRVLTQMSEFWCDHLDVQNHLIHSDVRKLPAPFREHHESLFGRTMVVRKAEAFPVECVVRGFLTGSAWTSYQETGQICGIRLPAGLKENAPFPKPLFTPTTKSDDKDVPMTYSDLEKVVGADVAAELERLTVDCYTQACERAWQKGVMIADTKFEFGRVDGDIVLIDEVLTPDSSRLWPLDKYRLDGSVPSLDKQYIRDYLKGCGWDRSGDPPPLTDDVVGQTRDRYLDVYRRIVDNQLLGCQV